jgi:hypothetical protein
MVIKMLRYLVETIELLKQLTLPKLVQRGYSFLDFSFFRPIGTRSYRCKVAADLIVISNAEIKRFYTQNEAAVSIHQIIDEFGKLKSIFIRQ